MIPLCLMWLIWRERDWHFDGLESALYGFESTIC